MSQNNPSIIYAGLDVAKASLELHLHGQSYALENNPKGPQGFSRLLKLLQAYPGAHVVCEATGGYERASVRALQAANIPVSVVEAGRVRHFASAKGRNAKTDQIDANVKACDYKLSATDIAELDKITASAVASQPH